MKGHGRLSVRLDWDGSLPDRPTHGGRTETSRPICSKRRPVWSVFLGGVKSAWHSSPVLTYSRTPA